MKIINATWEKRNLGCDAYEIQIERKDLKNFSSIMSELKKQDFSGAYVTVKMPVGNLEALHALEDDGFRFMETQFHMVRDLINYETPELISRLKNILEQKEVEKNDVSWRSIVNLMTSDMFYTDRIYLDPKLKSGTSCKRYQNWIMDLVHNPEAHLFVYNHKEVPIGFGLVKMNSETGIVDDLLEGVFEKYQDSGLGFMMFDIALKSYQRYGMRKLETSISSNNPAIINLDLVFGYSIAEEEFGISFAPEDIPQLKSLSKIIEKVKELKC